MCPERRKELSIEAVVATGMTGDVAAAPAAEAVDPEAIVAVSAVDFRGRLGADPGVVAGFKGDETSSRPIDGLKTLGLIPSLAQGPFLTADGVVRGSDQVRFGVYRTLALPFE